MGPFSGGHRIQGPSDGEGSNDQESLLDDVSESAPLRRPGSAPVRATGAGDGIEPP